MCTDHVLEVYRVDSSVLGTLLSSLVLTNIRLLFISTLGLIITLSDNFGVCKEEGIQVEED